MYVTNSFPKGKLTSVKKGRISTTAAEIGSKILQQKSNGLGKREVFFEKIEYISREAIAHIVIISKCNGKCTK